MSNISSSVLSLKVITMKYRYLIGVFAAAASTSTLAIELPLAKGQSMSWQCAPCHGTNGQEFKESMPPLAGMPSEQFIKAMLDFREGKRAAIIMDRVARGFTDDEIIAMSKWFEIQPKKQWSDASLSEAQKTLDATKDAK